MKIKTSLELEKEIFKLKKEKALLTEEVQALCLEVTRLNEINASHKKLNGKLRMDCFEEIEKVKKEADNLMMNKIIKYEKKIRRLKNEARTMLNFP